MATPEEWHTAIKKAAELARADAAREIEAPTVDKTEVKKQLERQLRGIEEEIVRQQAVREELMIERQRLQIIVNRKREAMQSAQQELAKAQAEMGRNQNAIDIAQKSWKRSHDDAREVQQEMEDLKNGKVPERFRAPGKPHDFSPKVQTDG